MDIKQIFMGYAREELATTQDFQEILVAVIH